MLFTDKSSKQKLFIQNNDGTLDKEITCSPYDHRDVTVIDDSTVAVSTSGGIRIINIDTKCTKPIFLLILDNIKINVLLIIDQSLDN
jgi:endonuclease YncB( thermonuclease family)